MTAAQELDVIGTALSKSREEIALDLRDCDEEFRVGYMVLLGEIDDAVAALASLRERQQVGPQWEPVGDGEYSAGKLLVQVLAGRYVVATKAKHDDNGQDYWNATTLSGEYRLCRRTQAGGQDG